MSMISVGLGRHDGQASKPVTVLDAAPRWRQQTLAAPPKDNRLNIYLRPSETYQTMDGVGATFNEVGADLLKKLPVAHREEVMASLFSSSGADFTYCRLPIGASDFSQNAYSLNDHPGDLAMQHFSVERDLNCLIPCIRQAMGHQPGLKLHASPWSPPAWMKTNGDMTQGGQLIDDEPHLRAYALYFLKFVEAYGGAGVRIDRVMPQNEGATATPYPSCVMPGEQMSRLLGDHMAHMFHEAGVETEIWAGTFHCNHDDHLFDALAQPNLRGVIHGAGMQYVFPEVMLQLRQLYPGMKLMHTESNCYDGRNRSEQSLALFLDFLDHMYAGFTNYTYWNMILDETGKSTWDWAQNSLVSVHRDTGTVTYNPDYGVMRLIGQTVRPGFRRINAYSRSTQPLAFLSQDGEISLLFYNHGDQAVDVNIHCPDLPATEMMAPPGTICACEIEIPEYKGNQ